jgi:hypothetical protein
MNDFVAKPVDPQRALYAACNVDQWLSAAHLGRRTTSRGD